MDNDTFTVIVWPDIQDIMDEEGFTENSVLINDEPLVTEYGSSAYLVRCKWLEKLDKRG